VGWDGGVSPLAIVAVAGAAKCGTAFGRPAAVVIELAHGSSKQRCHAPDGNPDHDSASNSETQRDTKPDADTDPFTDAVTHPHANLDSHANPDPNANPDPDPNACPDPDPNACPDPNTGAPNVQPRLRHRDGERGVDQHYRERLGAVHQRVGT